MIDEQFYSDKSVAEFVGYCQHMLKEMDEGRSSEKIRIWRKLESIQ